MHMRSLCREGVVYLAVVFLLVATQIGVVSEAAADEPPISESAAVERLLTADRIDPEWFDPAFLAQIPLAQIEAIVSSLHQQFGAFGSVEIDRGEGTLRLDRAEMPVRAALNAQGQFIGLFFGVPTLTGASPSELIAQFAALTDDVSAFVRRGDKILAERAADRPLAVGSAFKLAILKVYEDGVAAGDIARDRVVALRPAWRSIPSGMLQDWPTGAPVTLETLAGLMISISDNTATDAMIDILGREAVEAVSLRNRPFLTTREAALIKTDALPDLRRRYNSGDMAERRRLLTELAAHDLGETKDFGTTPTVEIEWFFTARELCTLIDDLFAAPAVAINPGPIDAADWARVAYKGGSELGVLNFTAAAERADGERVCATVTLNADRVIDEQRAVVLFASLFEALRSTN